MATQLRNISTIIPIGTVFSFKSKKGKEVISKVTRHLPDGQIGDANGGAYPYKQCVFPDDVMRAIKESEEVIEFERLATAKNINAKMAVLTEKRCVFIDGLPKPNDIISVRYFFKSTLKQEIQYLLLKKAGVVFSENSEAYTDREYMVGTNIPPVKIEFTKGFIIYRMEGIKYQFIVSKAIASDAKELFGVDFTEPKQNPSSFLAKPDVVSYLFNALIQPV